MDDLLLQFMIESFLILIGVVGILINIISVNIWMIGVTVIIGIVFYFLSFYYLRAAQDVKRLEGISKKINYQFFLFSHSLLTITDFKFQQKVQFLRMLAQH